MDSTKVLVASMRPLQQTIFASVVAAFYNDSGLNLYSVSLVLLLNIQKYLRERARSHTSNNTRSCKNCKVTLEFRNI